MSILRTSGLNQTLNFVASLDLSDTVSVILSVRPTVVANVPNIWRASLKGNFAVMSDHK